MSNITYDEAIEAFDYRDGELFWKPWTTQKGTLAKNSGKLAGYMSHDGYWKVGFKGKTYYAHQIVFLMHNGYIPTIVDHADHDTTNNRIENLRAADKVTNACNSKIPSNNTSGVKGVTWSKAAQKWQASIVYSRRKVYLGVYDDINDAANIVNAKRAELHGEFSRAA